MEGPKHGTCHRLGLALPHPSRILSPGVTMNDEPPPRLRGTPLLLARAAALTVSLGVLGFLVLRAGGGCRSADPSVVAEGHSAAAAPPSATAAASSTGAPQYFPGSKAWGGEIVSPGASSAEPARSAKPKPKFFPGSKSMGGSLDDG